MSPLYFRSRRPAARGFTLMELAVVLVIVTLLIGGMLIPISAQRDNANVAETQRRLDEVRSALIGFAIAQKRLPCPARSDSDGTEDFDAAAKTCTAGRRFGYLPWVTLAVPRSDAWDRLFGYSVTLKFANSGTPFSLSTPRDITVKTRDPANNLINLTKSDDIPAVVFSYGKNGYWAWPEGAAAALPDSTGENVNNVDEDTNAGQNATSNGGRVFVSRDPTPRDTPTIGEFDDLVSWISPNILYNRMVAAGQLP